MSTKFSVENNAVNQHASNLDGAVAGLNGQAKAFLAAIEGLPGVWKGTSYGSWDRLTQAWHQAMGELNGALADIKGRVGNAGSLYDRYESEQTQQLDSTMASAAWDSTKFRS
ncbi:MAG TPA: WXG100 family type VII secretion target [Mycobacteriales bacterium]|nr:WXG100 family type VII secretion target [Mycobacteriales bacterium]